MDPKLFDRAKGHLEYAIEQLKKADESILFRANEGRNHLEEALKWLNSPVGDPPSISWFARHIVDQWPIANEPIGEATVAAIQEYSQAIKS